MRSIILVLTLLFGVQFLNCTPRKHINKVIVYQIPLDHDYAFHISTENLKRDPFVQRRVIRRISKLKSMEKALDFTFYCNKQELDRFLTMRAVFQVYYSDKSVDEYSVGDTGLMYFDGNCFPRDETIWNIIFRD